MHSKILQLLRCQVTARLNQISDFLCLCFGGLCILDRVLWLALCFISSDMCCLRCLLGICCNLSPQIYKKLSILGFFQVLCESTLRIRWAGAELSRQGVSGGECTVSEQEYRLSGGC